MVVAFGDSLTAGFGAEPGASYPDFLQKELDRAGLAWRVVNAGVSGDTTTDGLNRVGDVLAYKPRVVILEFGGNDGLRGLPIETTRANLEQMVVALRKSGAAVVLAGMTLPPNYGPDYIHAFEQVFSGLAARHHTAFVPMIYKDLIHVPNTIQQDGIHPTAKGSDILADTMFAALKPLLHK